LNVRKIDDGRLLSFKDVVSQVNYALKMGNIMVFGVLCMARWTYHCTMITDLKVTRHDEAQIIAPNRHWLHLIVGGMVWFVERWNVCSASWNFPQSLGTDTSKESVVFTM
jgi:hypothetical protein